MSTNSLHNDCGVLDQSQDSPVVAGGEVILTIRTPSCLSPKRESSQDNMGDFGEVSDVGCLLGEGSCAEYNANNTWYFNGTNGCLNNNNRYNGNFRSRPVFDYCGYDNQWIKDYKLSLEYLFNLDQECRTNKHVYIEYSINKVHNLITVCHELNNFEVQIGEVRRFVMHVPHLREIIYCTFGDKLIQSFYALNIRKYLEDDFFIDDSYSCREGKGVLKAIEKFRYYMKVESVNYTIDIWLAGVDIRNFFYSIDCYMILELMTDYIRSHDMPHKEMMVYLTRILYQTVYRDHIVSCTRNTILGSIMLPRHKSMLNNEYGVGVPIGNWPSQVIGNFITTFVLLWLRNKGYKFAHYTDDSAIIVHDKKKWLSDIKELDMMYNSMHLTLHPDKRYLQHYSKGMIFLGRKLRFNRVLPSDCTYNTINHLVNYMIMRAVKDRDFIYTRCETFMQSYNSYMGMLIHMNTYNMRKSLTRKLKRSPWFKVFKFDTKRYSKIVVKKRYTTKQKYMDYIKWKRRNMGL